MKKTLMYLLLSILCVAILFGATEIIAKDRIRKNAEMKTISSDLYEIVYFAKPYKTRYSLSEIETTEYVDKNGNKKTEYNLDFDGTGMYMTVKHKGTGRVKNYTYKCNYFELDGKAIKHENPIRFYNYNEDIDLSLGEHTIAVILETDDGESVIHDFSYTIVADNSDKSTQSTEIQTPTQSNTLPDENLTIPDIKGLWQHNINSENCKIEVKEQDSNKLKLVITVSNERATQVAISKIDATLDRLWEQGDVVYGEGDFIYTDSYNNAGVGSIKISENSLTLTLDQQSNSNRGWDILLAIGSYTHSDKK